MALELSYFQQYCIIAGFIIIALVCMLWFVVMAGKQTPLDHIEYRRLYRNRYKDMQVAKANGEYEDVSLINERGFTLIELVCSLAVVGILSAIAVPYMVPPKGKTYQLEAKSLLPTIYQAQLRHYTITGQYANYLDEFIDWHHPPNTRYTYRIVESNAQGFVIRAEANLDDDDKLDIWTIDRAGKMNCVSNDTIQEQT